MKRFLVPATLALVVLAFSQQQASAWSKFNFNIGMNISREAAENNFLWGLFRNGPHPFAHQGGGGYTPDVPPGQMYQPMPHGTLPNPLQSVPAQGMPGQPLPQAAAYQGSPAGYNGTQPVGYSYPNYSNYYYPQNTFWTPPTYWFNNGN